MMIDQLEIVEIGVPVETREFSFGRFELYRVGGRKIGRAVYEPGWRWSEHVRPIVGTDLCEIDHVGFVVAGSAGVRMADGTEIVLKAGDFFAIPPGHDSWVIGDAEYVSLHLLGLEAYAGSPLNYASMQTPDVRAAYDRVALAYAKQFAGELAHKPLDRALLDAFAELTRGRGPVLEVGGGPCQVCRYLSDRGVQVVGTDLSPAMIEVARALHPGMSFHVADLLHLDDADASLAGLVAAYAIVHLAPEQLAGMAHEWARVVRPGGWLLVSFHVEEEHASFHLDEFLGERVAMDFRFHAVEAVRGALVHAGFVIDACLERRGHADVEHPSLRAYILGRRG